MARSKLRIVSIISAHNEGDIIYHVVGDLVQQGIEVYLIDHCSTDDTVAEASRWLGNGLIRIESFPDEAGYPERNRDMYVWTDILKRKEELASQLGADWYIHHDADEFRESPLPWMSFRSGIMMADFLGFNAIDFALLNFRPIDNNFIKGDDVRKHLDYFDWGEDFNSLQIKAWKNTGQAINLTTHAGHSVLFPGRRIFPLKFILRHYPIRSQEHGEEKVLRQRKSRFAREEREMNWHLQYDDVREGHSFLMRSESLQRFRPIYVRIVVIAVRIRNGLRYVWKDLWGRNHGGEI
jgi:glycosyltransferase involved in cell wall biosynthesis